MGRLLFLALFELVFFHAEVVIPFNVFEESKGLGILIVLEVGVYLG